MFNISPAEHSFSLSVVPQWPPAQNNGSAACRAPSRVLHSLLGTLPASSQRAVHVLLLSLPYTQGTWDQHWDPPRFSPESKGAELGSGEIGFEPRKVGSEAKKNSEFPAYRFLKLIAAASNVLEGWSVTRGVLHGQPSHIHPPCQNNQTNKATLHSPFSVGEPSPGV